MNIVFQNIKKSNEKTVIGIALYPNYGSYLAEQQGFEPWRHFHALRDFESRLFDQLEYCSITYLVYHLISEKSRFFRKFQKLGHFFHDFCIVLPAVGFQASGAVLDAVGQVAETAAALIPQRI